MAKSAKTKALQEAFLRCVCKGEALPGYPETWIALFEDDPGESGIGQELNNTSAPAYKRVLGTFADPVAATAPETGSRCDLAADVMFPKATGDWATITHVALMSAETAGTMLYYKALATPKTLEVDERLVFYVGDFAVTED